MPVVFWTNAPGTGPIPKYDGSAWVSPTGDAEPRGYNGTNNHGSIDEGGSTSTGRAIQTVPVLPSQQLTLSGVIYGASLSGDHQHHVRIRDGGPDSPVIAEYVANDPSADWEQFSVQGTPSGTEVTVEFGHIPDPGLDDSVGVVSRL